MGARRDTVKTIFALGIGNHERAVFQIHPHTGNAQFTVILYAIAVAIGKHLTNDVRSIGEHATLNNGARRRLIRAHRAGVGCGAIDAIAL